MGSTLVDMGRSVCKQAASKSHLFKKFFGRPWNSRHRRNTFSRSLLRGLLLFELSKHCKSLLSTLIFGTCLVCGIKTHAAPLCPKPHCELQPASGCFAAVGNSRSGATAVSIVEQLNAALDKGDVVSRTPLHQKFTEFSKRDHTARDEYSNIRQTGQTMALKKAFRLRWAETELPRNPPNACALSWHDVPNPWDEFGS